MISLKHCPAGFADAVTVPTNTQNRVERRDFVALDPVQTAIRAIEDALQRTAGLVQRMWEAGVEEDSG